MCVIASIPAGSTIDEKTLRNMWNRNPDGAGIAWLEDGRVNMYKSMKLKPFLTKFKVIVKSHGSSDILVHMRIATCGEVCLDNNHPFYLLQNGQELKDTVFAHNGQLFDYTPPAKFKELSDTRYFNELFWNNFNYLQLDDWRVQDMIGNIIGKHSNKFVILTANAALKAETYIINKHLGEYENEVWFSNMAHKPRETIVAGTSTGSRYDKRPYNWNGYNPDIDEDDKILEMIRQRDPSADSCEIDLETDEFDKYSAESGLYEDQLLLSPEFRGKIDGLLTYSGMNNLEEAAEYYWFDVNDDGEFICPDCGNELSDTMDRKCHNSCEFKEWDPDSYSFADMERSTDAKLVAKEFEQDKLFE